MRTDEQWEHYKKAIFALKRPKFKLVVKASDLTPFENVSLVFLLLTTSLMYSNSLFRLKRPARQPQLSSRS
jgi:hypothetical protein